MRYSASPYTGNYDTPDTPVVEVPRFKRHFEFTGETRGNLKRIRALIDLPHHGVKKGDEGGWLECYANLSGAAWVADEAEVSGCARVSDFALVAGDAVVSGNAKVSGNARVSGNAIVSGNAVVSGNAIVSGYATVAGDAWVSGNAVVSGNAKVSGNTKVSGNAVVSGNTQLVRGGAQVASDQDFLTLGPALSSGRHTTAFQTPTGVKVVTGCFLGTVDEFEAAIRSKHTGEHLDQYLGFVSTLKGFFNDR